MISKVLELVTGKDDVERVAYKEDAALLDDYLKTRRLLIPQRPKRFLDPSGLTQDKLKEMIEKDMTQLGGEKFEPWILEMNGKKRLPAFSSQKKMEAFSAKISKELNKVFSLGCAEFLLADIPSDAGIDYVDLNLFSGKSWEIALRKQA
jgi:hypothetical protein